MEKKQHDKKIKGGAGTVLLIDDEDVIIDVGNEMLNALGYEILSACGGEEAIDIYNRNIDRIDIVLLDLIMPGMTGEEIYHRLKAINPGLKVLLLSGCSIEGRAKKLLEQGCHGFIQKPFDIEELGLKMREILDRD